MRKTRIGAALFFAACIFLAASLSLADEISQIRSAIIDRQANWQAGETSMTLLSPAERRARLGIVKPSLPVGAEMTVMAEPPIVGAPATLDWRNNGGNFVTGVRDQGGCGSCWAFATTAALESAVLRAESTPGIDLNLSEQVLISCGSSGGHDAGSCSGGAVYPSYASDYIRDKGLPLETCYPYTASDGSCGSACGTYQTSTYQIANWAYVTTTSPTVSAIRDALVSYGPLATTMDVYHDFYSYTNGVYSYTTGVYEGGHAVLIVGYNDAGQYFIVKNSWGASWGESGYFKIAYSELGTVVNFGEYTIRYTGSACSYFVTPSSQSLSQPAGSGTVTVATQSGCTWTGRKQCRLDHGQLGIEWHGEWHGELFGSGEHGRQVPLRYADHCRENIHRHPGGSAPLPHQSEPRERGAGGKREHCRFRHLQRNHEPADDYNGDLRSFRRWFASFGIRDLRFGNADSHIHAIIKPCLRRDLYCYSLDGHPRQ